MSASNATSSSGTGGRTGGASSPGRRATTTGSPLRKACSLAGIDRIAGIGHFHRLVSGGHRRRGAFLRGQRRGGQRNQAAIAQPCGRKRAAPWGGRAAGHALWTRLRREGLVASLQGRVRTGGMVAYRTVPSIAIGFETACRSAFSRGKPQHPDDAGVPEHHFRRQPSDISLLARVVEHGSLPGDPSEPLLKARRPRGSADRQVFGAGECGKVVRLALSGAGKADADDRMANLEKAGVALAAKYFASGVETLTPTPAIRCSMRQGWAQYCWPAPARMAVRRTSHHDEEGTAAQPDERRGGGRTPWQRCRAGRCRCRGGRGRVHPDAGDRTCEQGVSRQLRREAKAAFEGTGVELTVLDEGAMDEPQARCWAWAAGRRATCACSRCRNGGEKGARPTVPLAASPSTPAASR